MTARGTPHYNGLATAVETLPAASYRDPDHHRHEIDAIWLRSWLCAGRSADLAEPLSFRTFRIGDQEALVLRDETGILRAFHNTCRHRGSVLRREECGRLKSRLITCPYHAWSYSLRGDLVRVPSQVLPSGFDKADYPLYPIAVAEWRGFVFVNFDQSAHADNLANAFDPASGDLANWPLEGLVSAHLFTKTMACNWKIFWENFNECLHCPGVHPELSALVPIYGRGIMARHDDPNWETNAESDAPEHAGTLRRGAETWSEDGQGLAFRFAGLTDAEREAGQTYAVCLPSMFIVCHVDYVRTVRLRPLGPDTTELVAEWLVAPEALEEKDRLDSIIRFGKLVLQQDADICEVNQRGLGARPHMAGVLMPEEYDLARFHAWVRART